IPEQVAGGAQAYDLLRPLVPKQSRKGVVGHDDRSLERRSPDGHRRQVDHVADIHACTSARARRGSLQGIATPAPALFFVRLSSAAKVQSPAALERYKRRQDGGWSGRGGCE